MSAHRKQIDKNERRITELDMLFKKVYEDNATGKLSDVRYEQLSSAYEQEQSDLKTQTAKLQSELDIFNSNNEKTSNFIDLVRRYTDFTELTTPMLNEFVDRVIVHKADKSSGERVQKVDVYLSFIGKYDMSVMAEALTPEEIEAEEKRLAKKLEQREYFRRRYAAKKEKVKHEEQSKHLKIA